MKTFTPGPWKFASYQALPEDQEFIHVLPEFDPDKIGWRSKSISVCDCSDQVLADVKVLDTRGFVRDFNHFEGNAYLIAAAPDLLEALEDILITLDADDKVISQYLPEGERSFKPTNWINRAKSVIKKARGL
jgi:hypothetical protein